MKKEEDILLENGVPQIIKENTHNKKDFDQKRVKVFADTFKDLSEQHKRIMGFNLSEYNRLKKVTKRAEKEDIKKMKIYKKGEKW